MPTTITWIAEVFKNTSSGTPSTTSVCKALVAGDNPEWAVDSFAEEFKLGDIIHHSISGLVIYEHGQIRVQRYSKEKD
jgi:hypothetical protein